MKPNLENLVDLFHSEGWQALKKEVQICLDNSTRTLKQRGLVNREFLAGECTAYETILGLELKYKDADVKPSN
jgi:hypothetical protein